MNWRFNRNRWNQTFVAGGMARPPQYARKDDDPAPTFARVKAEVKRMRPEDRATLLAWLAIYFDDQGELYAPAQNRRRDKATIAGQDYWLLKVPGK